MEKIKERVRIMKTRLLTIILLSFALSSVAQNFKPTQISDKAIQSQQIMRGGAVYTGTVYEPFTTAAPSEASYSPANAPGRKFFPKPGEEGRSDEYPIGDALVPLMVMAGVFCGVVALRRKRTAKNND